jgi:hypothetical protein
MCLASPDVMVYSVLHSPYSIQYTPVALLICDWVEGTWSLCVVWLRLHIIRLICPLQKLRLCVPLVSFPRGYLYYIMSYVLNVNTTEELVLELTILWSGFAVISLMITLNRTGATRVNLCILVILNERYYKSTRYTSLSACISSLLRFAFSQCAAT